MDLLTASPSEAIPTPIIAVVFTWVVDTGMPVRLDRRRQAAAAASDTAPCALPSFTMSMPTVFIMRSPPIAVPVAIPTLHSTVIQRGIWKFPPGIFPIDRKIPRRNTPMNFCPSCAPCINAIAAAPAICARCIHRLPHSYFVSFILGLYGVGLYGGDLCETGLYKAD